MAVAYSLVEKHSVAAVLRIVKGVAPHCESPSTGFHFVSMVFKQEGSIKRNSKIYRFMAMIEAGCLSYNLLLNYYVMILSYVTMILFSLLLPWYDPHLCYHGMILSYVTMVWSSLMLPWYSKREFLDFLVIFSGSRCYFLRRIKYV